MVHRQKGNTMSDSITFTVTLSREEWASVRKALAREAQNTGDLDYFDDLCNSYIKIRNAMEETRA